MFGVWLAGVLVTITASACCAKSPDMPSGLIGLSEKDVLRTLGEPFLCQEMTGGALNGRRWLMAALWHYRHEDCFGGVEIHEVIFDGQRRSVAAKSRYYPFSVCPAWLKPVRDALSSVSR